MLATNGGEVLGIIKDYVAIARGTVVVTTNAALAGGRSAVTALTTIRPSRLVGLRDRSRCATTPEGHSTAQAEQGQIAATVQGEVERALGCLELGCRKELDSLRQRLAELERQFSHQARGDSAGNVDPAN